MLQAETGSLDRSTMQLLEPDQALTPTDMTALSYAAAACASVGHPPRYTAFPCAQILASQGLEASCLSAGLKDAPLYLRPRVHV